MYGLRYYSACALSGVVWGLLVFLIARDLVGERTWGGLYAAPLIGISVGFAYRPAYRYGVLGKALAALASLYASTILFGLAVGLFDLFSFNISNRIPASVVEQSILGFLWGVTFSGYFLVFWPLAAFNHWLVGQAKACD